MAEKIRSRQLLRLMLGHELERLDPSARAAVSTR